MAVNNAYAQYNNNKVLTASPAELKSVDKLWVFIAVAGHPAITWNVGVCRQPAGIAVDGAIQLGRISMAFMQRWHDGRYE